MPAPYGHTAHQVGLESKAGSSVLLWMNRLDTVMGAGAGVSGSSFLRAIGVACQQQRKNEYFIHNVFIWLIQF